MNSQNITEKDIIPILQDLIRFRTVNPPGITIEAINYIAKIFKDNGIAYKIQEYEDGHANLIAEYGVGETSIILTGHIDVVPAGDENKWKYPSFGGDEHEGNIYGRGSTDMKCAVAAFVAILNKLKTLDARLNKKIKLLITSDEETGLYGAEESLKLDVTDNCDFIVVGEPTQLKIGKAHKGVYWLKIKIFGKSAHGSTPHLGVNAVEAAASLIPKLKATIPEPMHDILGRFTLNIGKIIGGTATNVVPEYCEPELDYRLVPNASGDDFGKNIQQILDEFNEANEARAELEILQITPSIDMTQKSEFLDLLSEKMKEMNRFEVIGLTYSTDGAILVPPHNTPFVIFGPGRLDKLHVTNEYVVKDEVLKYTNILMETILELYSS